MLLENIQINKKLPIHEDYKEKVLEAEFNEESIKVSVDYWSTPDPKNKKPLLKFECEDAGDYAFRQNSTRPANYMGPILNKYMSSSFKEKPIRKDIDFYNNVDLLGTSMQQFLEMAMQDALVEGSSFILPDSTATDSSMSQAQKNVLGVRPFLRLLDTDEVINYTDYLGHLMEIIVELEDNEGNDFYMYYNNESMMRIDIDKNGTVKAIGELVPHGYDRIPVVRVMPFEDTFITSGALAQLSINNLKSLEKVELFKSTFTRYLFSGVQIQRDKDGNPLPFETGNGRIIATESVDAKMQQLGADPAQASSIRESIKNERDELYKNYHISATQIQESGQAPSGYSIVLSRADFTAICNQIVKCIEQVEANLVLLINQKESLGLEPVVYPRNFIDVNEEEEITKLRDILSLNIPQESKNIAIEKFTSKFLKPQ